MQVREGKGSKGSKRTDDGGRRDKMISISMIEICDTFTRKLQMLLLVMPDGHMGSSYKKISVSYSVCYQGWGRQKGRVCKDTAGLTGEQECQRPEGLDRRIGPASVGSQRALRLKWKTSLS